MSHTQTYEINNKADESLQLIKVQNKKIQELYSQLEIKDNELSQCKAELHESQTQQVIQKEKIEQLNSLLNELETNITTRNDKEKSFGEDMKNIKETYEKQLSDLMEQLKIKEKETEQMKNQLKEMNDLIEAYAEKLLHAKEEIGVYDCNEKAFQEKAKELVSIIQSQDKELNIISEQMIAIKKENESIKTNFSNSIAAYKTLDQNHKENEDLIINLNDIIKTERAKNAEMSSDMNTLTHEYTILREKFNEASSAKVSLAEKEKVLSVMTNDLKTLQNEMNYRDTQYQNNQDDLKELANYLTIVTDTSLKWADTYIGQHHNEIISLLTMKDFCFNGQMTDINQQLIDNYERLIETLNDLYSRVNNEYSKYDMAVGDLENERQNMMYQTQNINKKAGDYNDELMKCKQVNDSNVQTIINLQTSMKETEEKLEASSKIIEEYEIDIAKYYDHFIEIYTQSVDVLSQSKPFQNIFSNVNFNKPMKSGRIQLAQLKELSFNCFDLALCLTKELLLKNKAIGEYAEIRVQCDNFKSELLNVKKSYSFQKNSLIKEQEEILGKAEKSKLLEMKSLEEEYHNRLEKMTSSLKEKDEEIEKLQNDNSLLYSQYLLSEKNFESYKTNRKINDEQILSKYEQVKQRMNMVEQDNQKMKSDFDLAMIQIRNNEQVLHNSNKENEELKYKVNDLIKQVIV